jgi:two-component system cell cycle sensor histidine kinase/response regulator CckA
MPAQHLHALLVEDDDAYAAMLQHELAAESGPSVTLERVRSLSDAILRFSAGAFDAVLLDLGLPDSSGLETFGRLQRAAGDTPIVVLTASNDDGLAFAAVHAGAQDYLVKSATDAQFLTRSLRYACERARLRRSLTEREARFRALVDQSQEAITLLDVQRIALYNSRAVETVTGYLPEDLKDQCIDKIVHDDDLPQLVVAFQRCLDHPGMPTPVEYRFRHRSGAWRFGEAVFVNHLENAAVRAVVANHRDVTERKEAQDALRTSEERLRQAHKMEAVGRLAGGIAHDFNNVLTAIFGYTDLLLEQLQPNDLSRSDVQEIRRSAERAASLTRQLLAFSRKQVLQPRVLDLNDVIGSLEPLLRRLVGAHVDIKVACGMPLSKVRADPGQIEQVLMNLCANARDAMPEGGVVEVRTEDRDVTSVEASTRAGLQAGAYVLLTVSDTGPGIPLEIRSHIFEPFFTTKEQGKGTGLGLATVYGIVKQSGGGIYLDDVGGARFTIYLPSLAVAGTTTGR